MTTAAKVVAFAVAAAADVPPMAWHLPTRCSEGDINAMFQYKGVWHLFHQWRLRPATAVGHQVSRDLLRWTRVSDTLASGASNDQQCFDGSASLVEKDGVLQPILMIDGGCGLKGPGNSPCMESRGTDTGGITAFPDDLEDPYLTNWTKLGPTIFQNCGGSAGPSPIWKNGDKYNLIAIHSEGEARFEALDDTFGKWKMVDPKFISARGGGGGLWHELPGNVDGVKGKPWPTHIFQANGVLGDGRPTFILGIYDPENETYTNVTEPMPVDLSRNVAYGQLSHSEPGGDSRTLHISWLTGVPSNDCATDGVMTSIRDLRFDPRIDRLVETPIKEYEQLRGSKLFSVSKKVVAGDADYVVYTGENGTTMDTEIDIVIPAGGFKSGTTIRIGARCDGTDCKTAAAITLHVGGTTCNVMHQISSCDQCGRAPQHQPGSWCDDPNCVPFNFDTGHVQGADLDTVGCDVVPADAKPYCLGGGGSLWVATSASETETSSDVTMSVSGGASTALPGTFTLLEGESSLPLRLMSDRRTIEVFAAGGRAVFSAPLSSASGAITVAVDAGSDIEFAATGWMMESIFHSDTSAQVV